MQDTSHDKSHDNSQNCRFRDFPSFCGVRKKRIFEYLSEDLDGGGDINGLAPRREENIEPIAIFKQKNIHNARSFDQRRWPTK